MKVLLYFVIFIICSQLFGCWSNTGDIEYQPVSEALTNKKLRQNITLAILDFPDNRPPIKGLGYSSKLSFKPKKNLVGIFFGAYKIRIRKLYSDQPITFDVVDALENLFEANGLNARIYHGFSNFSALSDERLAVKGQINEFWINGYPSWTGTPPKIEAIIDIDLTIIDTKYQRTIWTGKIEGYQNMGPNRGIFTGASRVFWFFKLVFSDAINNAWIDGGMLKALESLDEKALQKKSANKLSSVSVEASWVGKVRVGMTLAPLQ